ncbi:hypothetical protein CEXT_50721, partial [Caerostris extrusa]
IPTPVILLARSPGKKRHPIRKVELWRCVFFFVVVVRVAGIIYQVIMIWAPFTITYQLGGEWEISTLFGRNKL